MQNEQAVQATTDPRGAVDVAGLARAIAAMEDIAADLRRTVDLPQVHPAVRAAALVACESADAAVAEAQGVIRAMMEAARGKR